MRSTDVWCLGEALVDAISSQPGAGFEDVPQWAHHLGGAPANTAVALSNLGIGCGLLGCVGTDAFGAQLRSELESRGVNVVGTKQVPKATRIAYVLLDEKGDRQFHHFTTDCADEQFGVGHLPENFPGQDAFILHFGSIPLIQEPSASTTRYAIERARKRNVLISYDPNVRLALWLSEEVCRDTILSTLQLGDIVKLSRPELRFLTGDNHTPEEQLASDFWQKHQMPLLLVTLDADGAIVVNQFGTLSVPGFQVDAVDSTGAGDAFNAGLISGLMGLFTHHENFGRSLGDILRNIALPHLQTIIRRANAVGALACTKPGAWSALPTAAEWEAFLSR